MTKRDIVLARDALLVAICDLYKLSALPHTESFVLLLMETHERYIARGEPENAHILFETAERIRHMLEQQPQP